MFTGDFIFNNSIGRIDLEGGNIDDMKKVKEMYDGFIIGHQNDIYNPWSIVNYMHDRQLRSYWILTSSNKLIGDIICRHPYDKKYEIEQLMTGKPQEPLIPF